MFQAVSCFTQKCCCPIEPENQKNPLVIKGFDFLLVIILLAGSITGFLGYGEVKNLGPFQFLGSSLAPPIALIVVGVVQGSLSIWFSIYCEPRVTKKPFSESKKEQISHPVPKVEEETSEESEVSCIEAQLKRMQGTCDDLLEAVVKLEKRLISVETCVNEVRMQLGDPSLSS
jgi:hypothetical protein